jgi:uncharacterized iron-regulated membrane protein
MNLWSRSWHRWAAIVVLAPALLIFATGILLHFKKVVPWIQPTEHRGTGTEPVISMEALLAAAVTAPEAGIAGWDDVARIDLRPGRGVAKVQARSGWEVQVDLGTGAVVQVAYRRSDLIESLHDGRFFGDVVAWAVFTPAGVVLMGLTVTGGYLWVVPILSRRRARIRAGRARVDGAARGSRGGGG